MTTLHHMLDVDYGPDGDRLLAERLMKGADPNQRHGEPQETPLLDAGASVDYPEPSKVKPYRELLLSFASPAVAEFLRAARQRHLLPPD